MNSIIEAQQEKDYCQEILCPTLMTPNKMIRSAGQIFNVDKEEIEKQLKKYPMTPEECWPKNIK